jgi:hypothetical protein
MLSLIAAAAELGGLGCVPFMPLVATWFDRLPGILFALPLVAAASLVFGATHHEAPQAIRAAAFQWVGWLGGILGVVLLVVIVLAAIV